MGKFLCRYVFLVKLKMLNLFKKWLTSLKQENDKTFSEDLSVIWIHGANQSGLSFQYLRSLKVRIPKIKKTISRREFLTLNIFAHNNA